MGAQGVSALATLPPSIITVITFREVGLVYKCGCSPVTWACSEGAIQARGETKLGVTCPWTGDMGSSHKFWLRMARSWIYE